MSAAPMNGAEVEAAKPSEPPVEVVTRKRIAASPARVWDALVFYEQIDRKPPWLLRKLLPRPIRTEGEKSAPGDEALCLYEGGHLLKRVTRIEPEVRYEFEVARQDLLIGRGLRLHGGSYDLRPLDGGATELSVTTHYSARTGPAWLLRPIEAFVCHRFHHHLLDAIGRAAVRRDA